MLFCPFPTFDHEQRLLLFKNNISVSQFQLLECQEHLLDLEKSLENPAKSDRIRLLGGKDPDEVELEKKIEEVSYTCYVKFQKFLLMCRITEARGTLAFFLWLWDVYKVCSAFECISQLY